MYDQPPFQQPFYPQPVYQPPVLPWPSVDYPTVAQAHQSERFSLIVHAIQQRTKAPLSLCIQAALGVGSFLLQNLVEIQALDGQPTPAILHLIGIADPAEGKSSVMRYFLAPIEAYLEAANERANARKEDYALDLKVWEQTKDRHTKRLSKEMEKEDEMAVERASDASLTPAIVDPQKPHACIDQRHLEPSEPHDVQSPEVVRRRAILETRKRKKPTPPESFGMAILSEVTPAAIQKSIRDLGIDSLAIISAEAEEFLKSGIKTRSSILNKGWSLENTNKYLATRGDESNCTPITLILFGQPKIMEDTFGGDSSKLRHSGAVARGLFTYPPSTVGYRMDPHPHHGNAGFNTPTPDDSWILEDYRSWVTALLERNHNRHLHGTPKQGLRLSSEAQACWEQGRREVEEQLRPGGRYAEHKDHGNRLAEQWLRVAGVLHVYNHGLDGEIGLPTLNLAIHLVNSFSTEFVNIFRTISQEEKDVMKLFQWVQKKRELGHPRYITKSSMKASLNMRPVARFETALETLLQHGRLGLYPVDVTQRKKKVEMVDFFPEYPFDEWNLQISAFESRS